MKFNKASTANLFVTVGLTSFFSLMFSFIIEPVDASGEYWSGGFTPGPIFWFADSSISISYLSSYVNPGATGWNGISSRASLSRITSGSYKVRALTALGTDPNTYALTTPYCSLGSSFLVCHSSTWSSASVIGYENAMAYNNLTTAERIKVYTHEFGHVLSLQHVETGIRAVMVQGRSSFGVQPYDRENIRWRWGN